MPFVLGRHFAYGAEAELDLREGLAVLLNELACRSAEALDEAFQVRLVAGAR